MSSNSDLQSNLTFNGLNLSTAETNPVQQQQFSPNLIPYGLYPLPMAPSQEYQQNSEEQREGYYGIEGHHAHYFLPVYKFQASSSKIPILPQAHAKERPVLNFINWAITFISIMMIVVGTGVAMITPIVAFLASKTPLTWNMTEVEAVFFVAFTVFTMFYYGAIAITGILGIVSTIRHFNFRFRITGANLYFKSLIRLLVVGLFNAAAAPTFFRVLHFGLDFLYLEEPSWSIVILGIISLAVLIMCTCPCLIACAGVNLWNLRREKKRLDQAAMISMMKEADKSAPMIEPIHR